MNKIDVFASKSTDFYLKRPKAWDAYTEAMYGFNKAVSVLEQTYGLGPRPLDLELKKTYLDKAVVVVFDGG